MIINLTVVLLYVDMLAANRWQFFYEKDQIEPIFILKILNLFNYLILVIFFFGFSCCEFWGLEHSRLDMLNMTMLQLQVCLG